MSDTNTINVSDEQLQLLLRGLRYVRSSILLDPHLPSDEDDARREQELSDIEDLVSQMTGEPTAPFTVSV